MTHVFWLNFRKRPLSLVLDANAGIREILRPFRSSHIFDNVAGQNICNSRGPIALIRHPYVSAGVYGITERKNSRFVGVDNGALSGVGETPPAAGKSQRDEYQNKTY